MMIYQDWFEHTDAVTRGALRRFRAATGKRSATLHNCGILHDLGKADPILQKWYQVFCQEAHRYGPPLDVLMAHTLFRRYDKDHQQAEQNTNERLADILPDGRRPGHQRQGTALALDRMWRDVALLVSGHHGGLPDFVSSHTNGRPNKSLGQRFISRSEEPETLPEQERLAAQGFQESLQPAKELLATVLKKYSDCKLKKCLKSSPSVESDFFIRLMFSCLIDADWADTEQWMKSQYGEYLKLDIPRLSNFYGRIKNLEKYQAEKRAECKNSTIRSLRDTVYQYCVKAAQERVGVFTLNAPTGGNKTLGALAFALLHAKLHKLRRIIYVVPYLSIIEQNAKVIREALGLDGLAVFEHHSIADPINLDGRTGEDLDDYDRRQASIIRSRISNWDAPFIITTNVQFFDSLFSSQPGRCRKLHNIARSVVIFDEIQNVHPHYFKPTCQILNQWVKHCGTSFVLCTATQPQMHIPHKGVSEHLRAHPIIKEPGKLFRRAARVKVSWPSKRKPNLFTFRELAHKMVLRRQSCTIVDTRNKARELYGNLRIQSSSDSVNSIFHLSTSMCPHHRIVKFQAMREKLDSGNKVHLVATPILEAGVDISFPDLYREFAPFDLISQAGGRVNRHGEKDAGKITVFYLLDNEGNMLTGDKYSPPDKWYKLGRNALEQILRADGPPDINRPDELITYFRNLYSRGDLDEYGICEDRKQWKFSTISHNYRTIEDQSRPVVCMHWNQKYGDLRTKRLSNWLNYAQIPEPNINDPISLLITAVIEKLRDRPYNRWLHNLLSYFSANIFWQKFQKLQEQGAILTDEETQVDMWNGEYNNDVGLIY